MGFFLALLGLVVTFSWILCHVTEYLSKLPYWERCTITIIVTTTYTLLLSIIVKDVFQ